MKIDSLHIESGDLRRLFGAASADAALLYLYIQCGNDPGSAPGELQMTNSR